MNSSIDLLRFESQMLRLDHEILSLKFMVENAKPDLRAECYKYVRLLRKRYKTLQTLFQVYKEHNDNFPIRRTSTIEQALQDFSLLVGSTSLLLRKKLTDPSYYMVA